MLSNKLKLTLILFPLILSSCSTKYVVMHGSNSPFYKSEGRYNYPAATLIIRGNTVITQNADQGKTIYKNQFDRLQEDTLFQEIIADTIIKFGDTYYFKKSYLNRTDSIPERFNIYLRNRPGF